MSDSAFVVVGTAAETTVTVHRLESSTARPQGLVLDADNPLSVGAAESTRIVLWSDTAPETTDVLTRDGGEIRIWNVWRDGDLIQAWTGDASITVDDAGDDLGLSCHDGHGAGPDLEVRLAFDRSWTQPGDE